MKKTLMALSMLALPCISYGQYGAPDSVAVLNNYLRANAANFYEHSGKLYFTANDSFTNLYTDLWMTDGTGAGTMMLKDLPGSGTVAPGSMVSLGSKLLFAVDTSGNSVYDIWVSDGTTAGTMQLLDINPVGDDNVHDLVSYNGKVYFSANDGVHGQELWETDGTAAGTILLEDIYPGYDGSKPAGFKVFQNKLLYFAYNGALLRASDGTVAGTTDIKTVYQDAPTLRYLAEYNGKLYFGSKTDTWKWELWATDGTTNGTTKIKTLFGYNCFQNSVIFNNKLYFYNLEYPDADIWATDGTEAGTTEVIGGMQSMASMEPGKYILYPWNNKLYITRSDGTAHVELYVSDGTLAGTKLVKNISKWGDAYINSIAEFNGRLYFNATDTSTDLWTTDGTDTGTHQITFANSWQYGFLNYTDFTLVKFKDSLYFEGQTASGVTNLYRLGFPKPPVNSIKNIYANTLNAALYPNPAHGVATLDYTLKTAGEMRLTVTDITGKEVFSSTENKIPGEHMMQIKLANAASGMYFVKLEHNEETTVLKLVLQ